MKKRILFILIFIMTITSTNAQTTYTGVFKSPATNTDYHHFIRNNAGGAAVYVNQVSTGPIFRASSGTSTANQNVRFTIENNGNIGIGTHNPISKLEINGDVALARTHKIKFLETVNGNDRAYIRSTYGQNSEDYNSLIFAVNSGFESVIFKSNGNVGIGTTTPDYHLDVEGTIRAHEIKVNLNEGADFVFEEDYNLMPLNELETFVKTQKHLPEIAPATEMEAEGLSLSEMNIKLLQKIEELTLYVIELKKENEAQDKTIQELLINSHK